jgi:argininosuccinate lyase
MNNTTLDSSNKALWSGRFREQLADLAFRFSSSIALDGKLFAQDIAGSIGHVRMLGSTGIISADEAETIERALEQIKREIECGEFVLGSEHEDVHMSIECRLIEIIGSTGAKLHTGRSRNDQVALDERLWLKQQLPEIIGSVRSLQRALLSQAEAHTDTIMPGYTHMQRAQPVLLAHHLLAYVSMLSRDAERFTQALARLDRSPLGAAAFAGSPHPLDREMTASLLGFAGVVANSIDAVSDRDYLIEVAADASITMMHLSRLCEELILWSSREFDFVEMSDAVTTGSSIMPQKKNPDMAELVRGKTGRVYGSLFNLLTIMKGLPLAYNRDMQEDKQPMFDSVETTLDSLRVMTLVIESTQFKVEKMRAAVEGDLLIATEIADYLAKKGLPFREAHEITGRIVAYCIEQNTLPSQMSQAEFLRFSPQFEQDIFEAIQPMTSIRAKRTLGSTSPSEIERQIAFWRSELSISEY